MFRALAIETSGRLGSVAIVENGRVLEEDQFPHGLQHAAEIIPRIDRLCRGRNWSARDLEELYVSAGPGSFTGLRIGITLAKTLAFATDAKIVAVPSVEVLARNALPAAREIVIVLDAKRGQIFTARLTRRDTASDWEYVEPAHLDSLAGMLGRGSRPVHLLGEGLPFHQQFISADDRDIVLTAPDRWRARASEVASLGFQAARQDRFIDPDQLIPIYVRLPEAQEKREQSVKRAPADQE